MNQNMRDRIKHFRIYGIFLVVAIVIEVCIFNIAALRSSGYTPTDKTGNFRISGATLDSATGTYTADGEEVDFYTDQIGQVVHAIYLGLDFSDAIVSYDISITDAGNSATPYSMSTQQILQWQDASKYMTLHTYGEVYTMKITFHVTAGSTFTMSRITFDPYRQIHIRWIRVAAIFFLLSFCALFRKKSYLHQVLFTQEMESQKVKWGKRIFMFAFSIAGVLAICVMNLNFGALWQTDAYVTEYADLAQSLAEGRFNLDYEVSDSLKAMDNPYDYTARVAGDVESYWDNAYYNGSYYCYFGVTPVLTTYLPYYLITGKDLNNVYPNLIFALMTFLGTVWFVYEMLKRWFPKVPFYAWPIFSTLIGFSINLVYLYQRPDFYDIPVIAGNAFVILGFACWVHVLNLYHQNKRGVISNIWMALGSVSMALVAGCRPQMVLAAVLAIPLFWKMFASDRELFSRKSITRTVAFVLPFVIFGTFIMYYNAARFGSPFDFGANYNLTTNDMTKRGFNLDRLGSGLVTFLLQPPLLIAVYPFVQKCVVSSQYMGKMIIETLFGGIFATNLITLFCFGYAHVKHILKEKRLRGFILGSIILAILLSFVDATIAGILQRYTGDFVLLLLIPGCMIAGALLERLRAKAERNYFVLSNVLCVVTIMMLVYDFMVICLQLNNGNMDATVTYYQIRSFFVIQ